MRNRHVVLRNCRWINKPVELVAPLAGPIFDDEMWRMLKANAYKKYKNNNTHAHIYTRILAAPTQHYGVHLCIASHIYYTRMQTYHPNKSMAVNNEAPKKAVIQFNNIIAKMRFVHMLNFTWVFPWFHQKQSTYSKCHHNDKPSCWRRMGGGAKKHTQY